MKLIQSDKNFIDPNLIITHDRTLVAFDTIFEERTLFDTGGVLAGGFWTRLKYGEPINEGDYDLYCYHKSLRKDIKEHIKPLGSTHVTLFGKKTNIITIPETLQLTRIFNYFDFMHCCIGGSTRMFASGNYDCLFVPDYIIDINFIDNFNNKKLVLIRPVGGKRGLNRLFKYMKRGWRTIEPLSVVINKINNSSEDSPLFYQ